MPHVTNSRVVVRCLCAAGALMSLGESRLFAQCEPDIAALDDEFNADSLSDWQRHYEVDGWQLDQAHALDINQTSPGHLYIEPEVTSWYEDYRAIYLFKEVTGNFIVETRVQVTSLTGGLPSRDYSLAGVMVRAPREVTPATWQADQENWLFIATGRGADPNNPQLETKRTYNSTSHLILTPAEAGWVDLRIERLGQTFNLYARFPGDDWFLSRTIEHDLMPATLQVGLHAYTDWPTVSTFDAFAFNSQIVLSPPGQRDQIARYDYIHFTRPTEGITPAIGDLNHSGSVDREDVDVFAACATGAMVPITDECCEDADLDNDGDADQTDFAQLQRCFHAWGDAPPAECTP